MQKQSKKRCKNRKNMQNLILDVETEVKKDADAEDVELVEDAEVEPVDGEDAKNESKCRRCRSITSRRCSTFPWESNIPTSPFGNIWRES